MSSYFAYRWYTFPLKQVQWRSPLLAQDNCCTLVVYHVVRGAVAATIVRDW